MLGTWALWVIDNMYKRSNIHIVRIYIYMYVYLHIYICIDVYIYIYTMNQLRKSSVLVLQGAWRARAGSVTASQEPWTWDSYLEAQGTLELTLNQKVQSTVWAGGNE